MENAPNNVVSDWNQSLIDGVYFGEHLCVVALGIALDGTKHPLGLVEGSTENTTTVTELLGGLRDRDLDTERPMLFVLDESKALRAGVIKVFSRPVLARCQLHKIRNVEARLPKATAKIVANKMRAAYAMATSLEAEAALEDLARQLSASPPPVRREVCGRDSTTRSRCSGSACHRCSLERFARPTRSSQ